MRMIKRRHADQEETRLQAPPVAFADLPRGVASRALHEHQTPTAAFADPEQILAAPHLGPAGPNVHIWTS